MSKVLNCIILEDDPLYSELLQLFVKETPFLHLLQSFDNPVNALLLLDEKQVDLIISDVKMPQLTGTQFAKLVNTRSLVILISSSDEYAIEGFEVNAIDFLLKPFTYDRFLQAVIKAQTQNLLMALKKEMKESALIPYLDKDKLFVKSGGKIIKILIKEILYIEARKEYVMIYTEKRDKVLILAGISAIEEKLEKYNFIRVHKSFVIALDKVDEIEHNSVKIMRHVIPVALSHKQKLIMEIQKNGINLASGTKNN